MLGIYFNLSVWYKLKELTIFGAIFASIGAVVTIGINYFFIPVYGYMASAWGHLLSYSIMVIISYLIGRHYYPVPYNVKKILFYIFLGIGLYILSGMWQMDNDLFRFSLNTLLFLIFAIVVIIRERSIVKEIIQISRKQKS